MSRGDHKKFLLLSMGLLLAVLMLLGGVHHHDGNEVCWICIAVTVALLPFAIMAISIAPVSTPFNSTATSIPSWFLWLAHHRRGPPARIR